MTEAVFRRIVTGFADEVEFRRGSVTMELQDETVEVSVADDPIKGIIITRDGATMSAVRWIYKDIAKLELLARRITDYVKPPKHFVSPRGKLVDSIDVDPDGTEKTVDDASRTLREVLGQPLAGTTSVLYLTSEPGEGKTSLIEQVAVQQAKAYLHKETKTLLLPVPLKGRPFLRFDDAIIAALANQLRFPYWSYGGFVELVRLGAIVPAFDGFEEIVADSHSYAATSAFKHLIGELQSQGSILVAAGRAFVDLSLGSHGGLWRAENLDQDVQLRHLTLERWDKPVFLEYARKRQVSQPEKLFDDVGKQLRSPDHPVLTRAVLVRRLIDVACNEKDLTAFLACIGLDPTNYLHEFVEAIVEREVEYKWRDKSGGSKARLLSLEQHHELLSMLACEMWLGSVEVLWRDMIDMVVEEFADEQELAPGIARQVRERIPYHALLRAHRQNRRDALEFDHDDFRSFYLGRTLGNALASTDKTLVNQILDTKTLTTPVIKEATRLVRKMNPRVLRDVLGLLDTVLELASQVSYARENSGVLILSLLDNLGEGRTVSRGTFSHDILAGRWYSSLIVEDSRFFTTSLKDTRLFCCTFIGCRFERLVIEGHTQIQNTKLKRCKVDSVAIRESNGQLRPVFDPVEIRCQLHSLGFGLDGPDLAVSVKPGRIENDKDLDLALIFLNMFLRANSLPERAIRTRLGGRAGYFFGNMLPRLQKSGIVGDLSTSNHRIRLREPLDRIEEANALARGSFEQFVSSF